MTALPFRILCFVALALVTTGCARSENSEGASDSLGEAIAQRDSDQAAATIRREVSAREAEARGRAAAVRDVRRAREEEAQRTSGQ